MTASPQRSRHGRFGGVVGDPQVRVALVTAAALLIQAVIAKNVLDTQLDIFSQFAPLWVFLVYELSGERSRASEILTSEVIVLVTAGILLVAA